MTSCLRIVLLFFVLAISRQGHTDDLGESGRLVIEMCQFYHGENMSLFMSPGGEIQNPLLASPAGHKILTRNFKDAFSNYNYFSPDEMVKNILNASDYQTALIHCYGTDETAKMNFSFFLSSIEIEAKFLAGTLEAGSWLLGGVGFIKVTAWLGMRFRLIKTIVSWSGRAATTLAVLFSARVAYNFIQYKRGKLKKAELSLDQKTIQNAHKELDESIEGAKAAVKDLESQLENLKKDIQAEQDPDQKAKLVVLKNETDQLLIKLTTQMKS